MTPPTPTHTHIWDGTHTLPDWLTNHHWTDDQLVIRTPDGDTRPQAGWWLIGWTDGTVTVASPRVAERVYGADGIAGRLAAAETALARIQALPREPRVVHHIRIHGMPDQDAYNRGWSSAIGAVRAALAEPGPA